MYEIILILTKYCLSSKIFEFFFHFLFCIFKVFHLIFHDIFQIFILSFFDFQFFTHSTTNCKCFVTVVRWVFNPQWTVLGSTALGTSGPPAIMTMHAVVVIAATVISCYVATEIALVLNVLVTMTLDFTERDSILALLIFLIELALGALQVPGVIVIVYSTIRRGYSTKTKETTNCSEKPTSWCNWLLGSLLLLWIPTLITLPKSAKEWIFTCIALIVVQVIESEFLQLFEIFIFGVFQPLIQV